MNRLRAFDFPHKALRSILSRFTNLAGTIDYSNEQEVESLRQLGSEMFNMLEDHVHHENNHTFHQIEVKRPGGCKFEYDDHERVEQVQNELKTVMNGTIINGHEFYLQACYFQSVYLQHIHHEETVTEKLLWELFTDEELIQHRTEILKEIAPPMLMTWFKHGIPASTLADSIDMLRGFKQVAPPEAFQTAMQVIKPEMPSERYLLIERALA